VLLRESYRKGGKVKKRTIANLSACSEAEIDAIRLALQHKDNLADLGSITLDAQKNGPTYTQESGPIKCAEEVSLRDRRCLREGRGLC
jgi:hypothetical protein